VGPGSVPRQIQKDGTRVRCVYMLSTRQNVCVLEKLLFHVWTGGMFEESFVLSLGLGRSNITHVTVTLTSLTSSSSSRSSMIVCFLGSRNKHMTGDSIQNIQNMSLYLPFRLNRNADKLAEFHHHMTYFPLGSQSPLLCTGYL
jgi:hypothetical protein